MTALERQLVRRIDALERRVLDLQERSGLNVEAIDTMHREEAIEHMSRTGDAGMIKEYLTKKRGDGVRNDCQLSV